MSGTYSPTGTSTNLTRLELEEVRKADTAALGKALTVGDAGLAPEGVVGRGNPNAEPYTTGPSVSIADVYGVPPPALPGTLLGSLAQVAGIFAETVQWYGPTFLMDDTQGLVAGGMVWATADLSINYNVLGIQPGDLILVQNQPTPNPTGGANQYAVGVISGVAPGALTCSTVINPHSGTPAQWDADGKTYSYIIVRPTAVQLFAVPGSGPRGREQSFLAVMPGSALHGQAAPSAATIAADRVTDLVPPGYGQGDRADAVFENPGQALESLGYRMVLFPDDGTGTGPDYTRPITNPNPVIDPSLPITDQRVTLDYRAGVLRLSCAPATGSAFKPSAGCINAVTGRLNLYAVFWAVDKSLTRGVSMGVWGSRGLPGFPRSPARIRYNPDPASAAWLLGSTGSGNDLFIEALGAQEDYRLPTRFGVVDPLDAQGKQRYFAYYPGMDTSRRVWRFLPHTYPGLVDPTAYEVEVGDRTAITVGDSSNPPTAPGLFNQDLIGTGLANVDNAVAAALAKIEQGQFATVHLRRGFFRTDDTIVVPPGVVIEGEGDNTVVQCRNGTAFQFGPNTARGVYEQGVPTALDLTSATKVEGMDIVWNPVRRCWGVVYADLTLQALWFNEVFPDGSTRWAGLGVDIKNTATLFYSATSFGATNHTTGHYPRLAFCPGTGEYAVVWVETKTVGLSTGPEVKYQVFAVQEPAVPSVTSPLTVPAVATVSKTYASAQAVAPGVDWSNHPSIACDVQSSGVMSFAIVCWAFINNPGPLFSSSSVHRAYMLATPGAPTVVATHNDSVGFTAVVSSTDVTDDGQGGGYQFAWSLREHSLVGGTGTIEYTAGVSPDPGTSYVTDGVTDFQVLGVRSGSKFLWLGTAVPAASTAQTTYRFDAPSTSNASGYGLAEQPSYGDDGVVQGFAGGDPTRPTIKAGFTGRPYNEYSTHVLEASLSGVATLGGNVLNDASASFVAHGVAVGDKILVLSGANAGVYTVAGAIAPTSVLIAETWPAADASMDYLLLVGRPSDFLFAPRTVIQGRRSVDTVGTESALTVLAGSTSLLGATTYSFAESEPDYVRLGRGPDRFLLVYQSMNTTAKLSKDFMLGDTGNIWFTPPADNNIYLRERTAVVREHVGTMAVILRYDGQPMDEVSDTIPVTVSEFDEARARPLTQLTRSLGSRVLVGARPNYRDITGSQKDGQQMAQEVSLNNWTHRWTSTAAPSLLPDVTWNGEDFVVASPSKHETRSYVGNYVVNGSGVVTLLDATFYFGDGTALATASNKALTRPTLSPGDRIYFPATGASTTVASLVGSHAAVLAANDASLLNLGNNTTTLNQEWVLLRGQAPQHGPKNPGFRISPEGKVLASASYVTFSEELPDDAVLGLGYGPQTTLMGRGAGSDKFVHGNWIETGTNFPAVLDADTPMGSRWVADVGFRGPAVGQPRGTSHVQPLEAPLVALAWGETLYGALDRELSGGGPDPVSSRILVSRQSFGPYNNGLRSLRVDNGTGLTFAGSTTFPLVMNTRQKVWTRHGDPCGSQGFFATDGYRTCFVFAGRQSYLDADTSGIGVGAKDIQPFHVYGVYTDAIGLDPVKVHGPTAAKRTVGKPNPALYQDAPFAQEFYSAIVAGVGREVYPNFAAAPRVTWDGRNFAMAWWETSLSSAGAALLRFAFLPGGDHDAQPMDEMVSPADVMGRARAVGEVTPGNLAGYAVGSVALATSGKTYAAAWVYGMDRDFVGSADAGAMVAVTIFTPGQQGTAETYACEPTPYYAGNGTSVGGYLGQTQDQDYKVGFFVATGPVDLSGMLRVGDIVTINSTVAAGRYRIVNVDGTNIWLDRWIPSVAFTFLVHRAKATTGAKTYVLDMHSAVGTSRVGLGSPQVIWDGKQYVVAWRTAGLTESGVSAPSMMIARLGEDGVGSPTTVVSSSVADVLVGTSSWAPELDVTNPTRVYAIGGRINTYTSGAGTAASTIEAPGGTDWIVEGVVPGCVVTFGPNNNRQQYTVQTVTAANLGVDRALHIVGAQNTTVYGWAPFPRIKVGDTLQTARAINDGVQAAAPGHLEITVVRPDLHYFEVEYGLPSTLNINDAFVYGRIVNQAAGDPSQTFSGRAAADAAVSPTAVVPRILGRTTVQDFLNIGRIYGLAHNEATGEYLCLFGNKSTGASNAIFVAAIDSRTLEARRVVPVSAGSTHLVSGMAWNGTNLLVVWATDNGTVTLTGLRYMLLDERLRPVGPAQAMLAYGDLSGIGNSEFPGDGVVANNFFAAPGRIRNVQVAWNGALNRWVVAASVSTYLDSTPVQDTNSYQLPPERRLGNTFVSSVSMNKLILDHGGLGETSAITVGSKLVFRYNTVLGGGASQPEMVAEVLDIDYAHSATTALVTLNTAYFPRSPTTYIAGDITVAPREDVFLMTLSSNPAAVTLVDPDGVTLEDVTITGQRDVEERWKYQGRTVWKSSGHLYGATNKTRTFPKNGTIPAGDTASIAQQPKWMFSLSAPEGRLGPWRVRSRARSQHRKGAK